MKWNMNRECRVYILGMNINEYLQILTSIRSKLEVSKKKIEFQAQNGYEYTPLLLFVQAEC